MAVRPAPGAALSALALLIPFCASLAAHMAGPRPSPVPEPLARPSLAFEQYLVDLGVVPPSEEVSARFRFRNTGKVPVTVTKTEPSCGCLAPKVSRKTLKPNESSEIVLRVRTASVEPGSKEYTLKVHYQPEAPSGSAKPPLQTADLAFRVKLPPKQVLIQPRALIFYQLSEQQTERELTILDQRAKGLKITRVVSTTPLAQVTLGPASDSVEGVHLNRLKVVVAGHVEGRHQGVIELETDDPIYRRLTVPLIIEGQRDPNAEVAAKPGSVGRVAVQPRSSKVR